MVMRKGLLALMMIAMMGLLAACETAEERAERHFQSAMELLQDGDEERAIVEFRNVFKLNGQHQEARLAFARLLEKRDDPGGAFAQYLQIAEQSPEDLNSLKALARIAADRGRGQDARKYMTAGLALAPDDKDLLAIQASVTYAAALKDKDDGQRRAAAETAQAMIADLPNQMLLRRVVIDSFLRDQNLSAALEAIDAALMVAPKEHTLYLQRLSVLSRLGDDDAVETGLVELVGLFPEDPSNLATLIRWYVSRQEPDKAEAYLRADIDPDDQDPAARLRLIGFLNQVGGPEVALAELNRVIAGGTNDAVFRVVRAGILFDRGEQKAAIAEIQEVLDGAEASEQNRGFKVALARMLQATGDAVAARALIEEVLTEDSGHVDALKLKVAWLIEDDALSDAITLLRVALDQSPQDTEIMTLMASAYERGGDTALMAEMLARVVEVSNKAPAESIRYAAFLAREGKLIPAESVLIDALRLSPDNVDILIPLGRLYVEMKDWPRTKSVIDALERIDTPKAVNVARSLRVTTLQAQDKVGEALDYLQGLVGDSDVGTGAQVEILRTHLANGDIEKARTYMAEILAVDPENPILRFVQATVLGATGEIAEAERIYQVLLEEDQTRARAWTALYSLQFGDGRPEAAEVTLDKALEVLPDSEELLWIRAGVLERANDIAGAIEIYEGLYERNSSNTIIANNLASLLSSFRDDPGSLDRAFVIARRLNGTTFPPFQDTYGWLMHLRGNSHEALDYIEPAAKILDKDPLVQFHLAQVYAALERTGEALEQYRKVLNLVGELDSRTFVKTARSEVIRLQADRN